MLARKRPRRRLRLRTGQTETGQRRWRDGDIGEHDPLILGSFKNYPSRTRTTPQRPPEMALDGGQHPQGEGGIRSQSGACGALTASRWVNERGHPTEAAFLISETAIPGS